MSYGLFQALEPDWFLQYSSTVQIFETTAIAIRVNGFYEQFPASEETKNAGSTAGSTKMNNSKKIKLRKQMARYLQQDEKIQPLDFYNWLHIC